MSEKGKRATPAMVNGAGKAAAGSNGKKFSAALLKLASDFEKLSSDTEGLQDYEKVLNSQADLQQKLEQKNHEVEEKNREMASIRKERNMEVATLQKKIDKTNEFTERLFREHEARHKDWETEKERHTNDATELSRLRNELEMSRTAVKKFDGENRELREELGQCKEQLDKRQDQITILENQYNLSDLQLRDVQKKLQSSQNSVAALEQKLGILRLDQKKAEQNLKQLATELSKLVHSYFGRELPDPSACMYVSGALSRVPQVASNSPAAQSIRCALAEAVIAKELSRRIFQDIYLPGEAAGIELSGLMKALAWLNGAHPQEATIVRCQLAKACTKSTEVGRIPTQAAESVCAILNCWLNDDTARQQQFVINLTTLFSEAMEVWKGLQRSHIRVKAIAKITEGNWFEKEDRRREYDSIAAGEQRQTEETTSVFMDPLAVLFPQILADGKLLFHGYALFPMQAAVIAASQERSSQPYPRNTSVSHRRRESDYESGDHRTEQQAKGGRRLSSASLDGAWQRLMPAATSDSSHSSRANSRSVRGKAERTT